MSIDQLGAAAGGDNIGVDDDDPNFNTPPESLEDLRLKLSPDIDSTEEYIRRNQEWIAKSEASVRELKATVKSLIGQTSSRKAELQNRTLQMRQMKKEIEEISMEAIEKEEEELKKLIVVETERQKSHSDTDQPGNFAKLEELKLKLDAYKEHLGLEIDVHSQGEWIEFIFTRIDPESTNATYSIKLTVDNEHYKCISCDPKVPKLEDLFQQLNTHHDLHQFMTELRTEFKNIANKEN